MNILPKKRWHVRTKDNIARVRRDEAKAAEEAKQIQERAKLAESEARRQLLLQRSRDKFKTKEPSCSKPEERHNDVETSPVIQNASEHVNFFSELEEGTAEQKQTNKEHEKELKEEKEKYEKQIGYLTYLGQDTNEALGKKSWYETAPERNNIEEAEINLKSKVREDPLLVITKMTQIGKKIEDSFKVKKKYEEYKSVLHKNYVREDDCRSKNRKRSNSSCSEERERKKRRKEKKHKKAKKHKKKDRSPVCHNSEDVPSSDDEEEKLRKAEKRKKLEALRAERLNREKQEKRRSEELLAKVRGDLEKKVVKEGTPKQKYNSQFNPNLAKQNYDTKKRKS